MWSYSNVATLSERIGVEKQRYRVVWEYIVDAPDEASAKDIARVVATNNAAMFVATMEVSSEADASGEEE